MTEKHTEDKYKTSRKTLLIDFLMSKLITLGGIAIILAVSAIFIFIFIQILPLFKKAEMKEKGKLSNKIQSEVILAVDNWGKAPLLITKNGKMQTLDIHRGETSDFLFSLSKKVSSVNYNPKSTTLVVGSVDGYMSTVNLNFRMDHETRAVSANPSKTKWFKVLAQSAKIDKISYGDTGKTKVVLAQTAKGLFAAVLKQKKSMLGAGKIKVIAKQNLSELIDGDVKGFQVSSDAEIILIQTNKKIYYCKLRKKKLVLIQSFQPFNRSVDILSVNFINGNSSVILTDTEGNCKKFSLFIPDEHIGRVFGETMVLPKLPIGKVNFTASTRNKSFLIGVGKTFTLYNGTTGAVLWQGEAGVSVKNMAISSKYNAVFLIDDENSIYKYELADAHPDADFATFFGKIWYEGAAFEKFAWQSTGGSDDFEAKLSLIPLIFGTIKGALVAMLFAMPIALMAAVYTSQFLDTRLKAIIKPMIEILASVPSVVLGFIGALWLAPFLEDKYPALLLFLFSLPLILIVFSLLWVKLPREVVRKCSGYEFIICIPIVLLVGFCSFRFGPVAERFLFTIQTADGKQTASFFLWAEKFFTGTRFEQRNALIAGFMMGLTVIPLIFTIAEDSLSNVPKELISASLALGASQYQTVVKIIIPAALGGILAATMIGLGRAVGETMIVLMATGNTPIMDMNIFSGMRTLSANIAVEIPEAPVGGTLYRAIFLCAFVLFILTFCINSLAEYVRVYVRKKWGMQ